MTQTPVQNPSCFSFTLYMKETEVQVLDQPLFSVCILNFYLPLTYDLKHLGYETKSFHVVFRSTLLVLSNIFFRLKLFDNFGFRTKCNTGLSMMSWVLLKTPLPDVLFRMWLQSKYTRSHLYPIWDPLRRLLVQSLRTEIGCNLSTHPPPGPWSRHRYPDLVLIKNSPRLSWTTEWPLSSIFSYLLY